MNIFTLLLAYVVSLLLFLLVAYYRNLFADGRTEYARDEVKPSIALVRRLLRPVAAAFPEFAAGGLLSLLLSFLGGFSAGFVANLFHSALWPLLMLLVLPFALTGTSKEIREFLRSPVFYVSFAAMTFGMNLLFWGAIAAIDFFWMLFQNTIIICTWIFYPSIVDLLPSPESDS